MNLSIRRSERRLTSALLLLGFVCGLGGVLLFLNVFSGGSPFLPGYLAWERSLIGAAAVAISLGFGLLAASLRAAGERLFSWIGLGSLALGTALTLLVEGRTIATGQEWQGGMLLLIEVFVVLTFIGQAAYGVALLQTALLPHWVGWLLVIWNLAWLAVVFAFSARDPYYPVLFYACPLVLGLLLVRSARASTK
jgi:hypothetical protein